MDEWACLVRLQRALVSVKAFGKADMNIPMAHQQQRRGYDNATTEGWSNWGSHGTNRKSRNSVKRAIHHMVIFMKTNSKNAPVLVVVLMTNFLISSRRPSHQT